MKCGSSSASYANNRLLPLLTIAVISISLMAGCSEKTTETLSMTTDGDSVATMLTRNVTTLISDSGITRYRITAPLWAVYEQATEPHWRFPQGLLLEKLAPTMHPEATIVSDSATYFSERQLWRLDGNVNILNTKGEKFLTQQVFWDQRNRYVYSDSFIHIERADRIIEGHGFKSNERMTTYSVTRPTGIFPVSDFHPEPQPADSIKQ